MGDRNIRFCSLVIYQQCRSGISAFAQQDPIYHKRPDRITRENTRIQSKEPCVDRGDCSLPACYRRRFFRADRGVQCVMDIEADLGQVKPEKVYFHRFLVRELACNLSVFDAVVDGFEVLGGGLATKTTE